MASLTDLLLATLDPSKNQQAEAQIKQAEQQNAEQYFLALAQEIANPEKPLIARQLSGLLLKNALASPTRDPARNQELKRRWAEISPNSRNVVKEATTQALIAQEIDVGKAAAQVLAKIGAIEIPANQWDGLVPLLLQHVTNADPRAKMVALVCLGYLCEELVMVQEDGTPIDDKISNNILTAVVQGMRDAELSCKLEATRAFYHTVVLAQKNFRTQNERDFIMTVLVELCRTTGGDVAEFVQVAAFECLVQIATEYYDYLLPYMNVIGPLTWETIRNAPEKVGITSMEFWSTVCDEELYLQELMASGQAGDRQSKNFIQQALGELVPLLTSTLAKQQSEDDDDTWNLAMAAGTCLGLVAQVTGDFCVDNVLTFVSANFVNQDWRYREAAILAYGSIMEGPSSEKMRPLVQQSYEHLVNALNDQSVAVRDTVAWTLGRIAQFHPTIVPVKNLCPILSQKLGDVPRVAANICFVIQVIAENGPGDAVNAPPTTEISEFFMVFAENLLKAATRQDAEEKNLRMSAYNALSTLVQRSGDDCLQSMGVLMQEMLKQLTDSFSRPMDKECELQSLICGVLSSLVARLKQQIAPVADKTMEELLKVIQAYQQVKGAQVVPEEALYLATNLMHAVGPNFEKYMPHFAPHLTAALQNHEDVQVCITAIGVVGDVCRALEVKIITYCDNILQILYASLQNQAVDRKIKAAVMQCFGDIALAVQGDFDKYLAPVVQMLHLASMTKLEEGPGTEDWFEYLNQLREGVLNAYTCIIHGMKGTHARVLQEHVQTIIKLVELITVEKVTNDAAVANDVVSAAMAVVGDLLLTFQGDLAKSPLIMGAAWLPQLVQYAQRCEQKQARDYATWVQDLLRRHQQGALQN